MKWVRTGSEYIFDAKIFKLRRDSYECGGRPTHPFFVLESNEWVNVVPLTPEGEVVLVRQFRHGIEESSLEVPGGLVDTGETPAEAAGRELLEETGYAGDPPRLLAAVTSNPAILTNRTHCFAAENARLVATPSPDPNEHIQVEIVPRDAIAGMLAGGEIHHSLSVCALTLYLLAPGDT